MGKKCSPIELLLLGSLRYLGRGWTFGDLEENTAISAGAKCQFFHASILWGSTTPYKEYQPTTEAMADDCAQEMSHAGFHGSLSAM